MPSRPNQQPNALHFINKITEIQVYLIPNAMLSLRPLAPMWICRRGCDGCAEERGADGGHFPEAPGLLTEMEREGRWP